MTGTYWAFEAKPFKSFFGRPLGGKKGAKTGQAQGYRSEE
jgi:hypothetical protein